MITYRTVLYVLTLKMREPEKYIFCFVQTTGVVITDYRRTYKKSRLAKVDDYHADVKN